MYCLENAVSALRGTNPWLLESVDFEPLEGLTDGRNRVFRTPHRPLDQSSGLTIYNQEGTSIGSGAYTVVSWDSGVIRFDRGVSEPYYADYYVADKFYSESKLKDICQEGFRNLMSRWPQDWYLVTSGGSTYISSTTPTLTDPPIGGVTFSTSHEVLHAYHLCCEYELASSRLRQATAHDVDYREGMSGGVAVYTKHRAPNLLAMLEHLDEQITEELVSVEEALSGEGYGAFVSGAKSDAYEDVYEWWDDSDQAAGT